MKTFTKSTALLIAALLISLNIFATGFEFEEEQYIDDIPFNLEQIETQVKCEQALAIDFSLVEEEYIDDIPFSQDYLTRLRLYADAVSQQFSFEEEGYIDDIPTLYTIVFTTVKHFAKN